MEQQIGICGHFQGNIPTSSGQVIKTRIITQELTRIYGRNRILTVDSHGGIANLGRLFFQSACLLRKCDVVILLPAHNGLLILLPFYYIANKLFHKRIIYVVIGGWLIEYMKRFFWLKYILKRISHILVETSSMKQKLNDLHFSNVLVMPNFKRLDICKKEDLSNNSRNSLALCTFSRVMKEKGIEEIIDAVKQANQHFGKDIYTLDIYGKVEDSYQKRFAELIASVPQYIKYNGLVDYNNTTTTLKKYFALVFPTLFFTEGVPGTIIDAYAAGLPVIASRWENYNDVVDDNLTGIGYNFSSTKDLIQTLINIAQHPEHITLLRENCLSKAKMFIPEFAITPLIQAINL